MAKARTPLPAVSLFSNCGAGDIGFASAGFSFEVMAELDARRLSVALLNHPHAQGVPGDLRETLPDVVKGYRQRLGATPPAILAACPPCQGLSSAQSARGMGADADAGSRDARNLLVEVIAEAVRQLAPRAVVVENVQAFLTRKVRHPHTGAPVSAATFLIDELEADYEAHPLLADLADFGVPQSRKRSFLTFIRRSEAAVEILERRAWSPYPWPSHATGEMQPISLREALASFQLPSLDAGAPETASADIPMHSVPVWPSDRYRMVASIPPNTGRSAWENDRCFQCGRRARERSRVRCSGCGHLLPRPVTKDKDGVARLVTGFHTSYRRMAPDEPASTVTTASGHVGSDTTIHPWENRVLSTLECALLQTFPPSFQWGDSLKQWGHTNIRAMIGEAVPPLFTQKHGRILSQLLRGIPPRVALSAQDPRVIVARQALERSARLVRHGAHTV
ncbi:MAG: DNA cytosine methyltransferase [Acidimicrobiales bacterium]